LNVSYGSAKALFDVSFTLPRGSTLALLGSNGAGKTTTARALCGLIPSQSRSLSFNGADIRKTPAHRIRRMGLTYLPEGRGIFPGLSVADNLRMAVRWLDNPTGRAAAIERAYILFPVLRERQAVVASNLSGGEQQMLSVAGGLAVLPRLLIADELSLGLAPAMFDAVLGRLRQACEEGVTVILIEQYVHRALDFADQCIILRRGVVEWQGVAAAAHDEVLDRYLGSANEPGRS
jgi:branched-chain amino acid transport system ATP-binding protein